LGRGTALSEDALHDGDWAAVQQAVIERRSELHMTISYLARETGLSPTTIRYLGAPAGKHNKSTLVALSVVLGWRYNHLINILRGEPEKNTETLSRDPQADSAVDTPSADAAGQPGPRGQS
jgi:hypothetical protein